MFKFYGKMTEKCINDTARTQNKNFALIFSIFVLLMTVVTVMAGVFQWEAFISFLGMTIWLAILNILLIFVPHKSLVFRVPRIIIIENGIITITLEEVRNKPKIRKIEKIKKIIDEGDWYFITFKWDITDTIVIQKDWIQEGTIEEFEEFFKDKIVRKTLQNKNKS